MKFVNALPVGSIEAIRPVFMIVMGVFLMIIAWRLCKLSEGWTARLMVAGSLLLGVGYALIIPLYEAGIITRYSASGGHLGSGAAALAWRVVTLAVMNGGWLLFGLGLAMHARIFSPSSAPRKLAHLRVDPPREFTI
jgi:hypothetical protein